MKIKIKIKRGDRLKLLSKKGFSAYQIANRFKIGNIYTVDYIKSSGGLIFKEVNHPENMFGEEQGLIYTPERFLKVK